MTLLPMAAIADATCDPAVRPSPAPQGMFDRVAAGNVLTPTRVVASYQIGQPQSRAPFSVQAVDSAGNRAPTSSVTLTNQTC
jgi:hypothetical protein